MMMLIALFLLYRIAYPKKTANYANNDVSDKVPKPARSVMGKSRFVLPDRSKPIQTPAIQQNSEPEDKKPFTFAPENKVLRPAVIPPDELNKVFEDEPSPEDLDIQPDDDENEDEIDIEAEEEAERFGQETMFADGLDFDDLQHVAEIVKEQPETVSRETGAKIASLEHTDMFEMLVSGNEGKMNWIKSVIDRHVHNSLPEAESEISETDNSNFDTSYFVHSTSIADFLGIIIKQ